MSARTSGSAGSFAKATRHFRMSPGGVTSASSRRTPVLPPSSAMATTAARVQAHGEERADGDGGAGAAADDHGALHARRASSGGVEPQRPRRRRWREGPWVNAGFAMGRRIACGSAAVLCSRAGAGCCGAAFPSRGPGAVQPAWSARAAARRDRARRDARSRWATLTR
ncbi:hypothetical protein [Adlercreutzia equolifaciens]|uniref:hypothetical protein n=1 Tax=Adlercreutzia equolifaciens TaxID=446660 RepID=UPI00352019DB